MDIQRTFHLHMISDSTGETLTAIAKAVRVQYAQVRAIEHLHPLVRSRRELDRVLKDVETAPGIVLYTLFNRDLAEELEKSCKRLNVPCVPALQPILKVFESYLGTPSTPTVGGQHVLDADYFRRIEALNFTMLHDDGHLPANLNDADIILLGISRTSKTPTSIYLANRGFKTANVPLVTGVPLPPQLEVPTRAFVVALVASAERISQVRQNRVIEQSHSHLEDYVDRDAIAAEIAQTRQLCARYGWPIIDVTRRSIEETAAAIIRLYSDREAPVLEA
ncbi:MAG: pyruvate, water dikinase regulatory protein [Methyloceanibacter sp.]|jgi:regulator of PEP synthase PpsR (kinase-PPPase family)